MEGIQEIKDDLQATVTDKMNEVTEGFVTKEELQAQKDLLEAQKEENETLKTELASKDEVINANKDAIATLDSAVVEMRNKHQVVSQNDDMEADESLSHQMASKIMELVQDKGVVSKTVLKAGADVHTIDDGTNPAVADNIRTWFAQLFAGISFRKRSRAEWINALSSVPLVGYEVMKLAIKDDVALPTKVGECELKPTTKVDIELYKRKACKTAEVICFSDEYRLTFRNLFSEILNVFRRRIARAVPQLMVTEIIDQSVDFQNVLGVTLPAGSNIVDAVEAAICEAEEVNNCDIDQIHMSPRLYKSFKNLKDLNGRPLFSCCNGDSNDSIFGTGVTLYENNDLPDADGILYLDSSAVNRADSNEISFEEVTDKDDKIHNKTSYLIETWFGIAIHPCDQPCVVYDTLTDIKAQLGV